MPEISPARTNVAQSSESYRAPNTTVTAQTGMNLPSLGLTKAPSPPQTGQQAISIEDKSDKAVTLSPQLTQLARKQQKLQQEIADFQKMKAASEAEKADYIPKSAIKQKMEANAVAALQELGYSYDEITNLILNQQQSADPNKQELNQLREEVTSIKTAQEQAVSKQYDAIVNQYKSEIKALVDKDANFSTVKELGREDAVLQHIIDTFNEDGKTLTVDEAAKDIEEYLETEAMKMAGLSKVKAKLVPVEEKKSLPAPKTGLRTLTQAVSTAPQRAPNQFQHMSMKERIAQAVARAQK